ncbi:MAG: hypothetical protein ACE5FA_05975 [Dehalococcoidia bacterium]
MQEPQPTPLEGEPAKWVEELMRDYQDKLTCGLYESIYALDGDSVNALMKGQARTCASAFIDLAGLPVSMELAAFLDRMLISSPSQLEIRREGDVIYWTEVHHGECVCPLIRRDVIRLNQKLCLCGAHWVKDLFERVADTRVEVETVETVATGADNCRFRITILREDA